MILVIINCYATTKPFLGHCSEFKPFL